MELVRNSAALPQGRKNHAATGWQPLMPIGFFRLLSCGDTTVNLPPGPWRAVYVQRGAARITPDGAVAKAGEGLALGRSAASCRPTASPARFWIWEWSSGRPADVPAGAEVALAHEVGRYHDEPDGAALLRMEEVALHPGAETARHTHAGCGLRVLVAGHIDAEVGDRLLSLSPGDCWLERGPEEPVIGRAGAEGAVFVRVMVLAGAMKGQDSYRPWGDDTDRRGRPASYKKFFESEVS